MIRNENFKSMSIYTLSVVLMILIACNRKSEYSKTSSGLQYRFIENKNGKSAKIGDYMRMHLLYKNERDSVLYDSKVIGDAFVLQLTQPGFIGGLEEGFAMMSEGDSAHFIVSADSMFEKTFRQKLPAVLKKGEKLKFEIRMKKLMNETEFNGKPVSESIKEELSLIKRYLEDNQTDVAPVREGIYYIQLKEGKGSLIQPGDSVEIKYTGRFLDGQVFDGSQMAGGSALRYRVGDGRRLLAWEQAVTSMKAGGISRLVLSSSNAYGASGAGPIPPNTPVIYDIEVIRVLK